jgi:EAL domain-containing protein (putative c-di-GMP-specific phosphodiesterase class I)
MTAANTCLQLETCSQDRQINAVDLQRAIINDELVVHYQPRYQCTSGHADILEALVRWQHPTLGMLTPDKFIAAAEEFGLICLLGLRVFEQCCKDIHQLRKQLKQKVKIAVNVSLLQCEDKLHAQKIFDICEKHNLDLSDFEFELTESENIKNRSSVLRFCNILTALGAEISLDDFGTCYSPLNNLCDMPDSYIKVDRCYTKKIGNGSRSEILIQHLIKLAHEMKIKVVAEGVEHAYQRDLLITMGCDQLQGFHMCRPLMPQLLTAAHIDMQ